VSGQLHAPAALPAGKEPPLRIGYGRAIAEAFSRWLPTAAARVQSRIWSSGICGGHRGRYNRPINGRHAEWKQFGLHPHYAKNYLLDLRLGEAHSRSGRFGEEKILDTTGTRTPTPQSSSP
jgi:hypothetical protein